MMAFKQKSKGLAIEDRELVRADTITINTNAQTPPISPDPSSPISPPFENTPSKKKVNFAPDSERPKRPTYKNQHRLVRSASTPLVAKKKKTKKR